jgi:hypothetical protein
MTLPTAQSSLLRPPPDGGAAARSKSSQATSVAWSPQKELDDHEWVSIGRRLGAISRCSQWWIGDWVRYGTTRWGDRYTLAARVTGYDNGSLRNMAWVASSFEPLRRRENLTWSHHAAVAMLPPDEQDDWLDRVAVEKLSVADLRLELRAALRAGPRAKQAGISATTSLLTCPRCGFVISTHAAPPAEPSP